MDESPSRGNPFDPEFWRGMGEFFVAISNNSLAMAAAILCLIALAGWFFFGRSHDWFKAFAFLILTLFAGAILFKVFEPPDPPGPKTNPNQGPNQAKLVPLPTPQEIVKLEEADQEKGITPKLPPPEEGTFLEHLFAGYSCAVNSYGGTWAESARKSIQDDLYDRYGCTLDPDASMKPGCKSGFHAPQSPTGPWNGFAWTNAVLYYSDSSKDRAEKLAAELSKRYARNFTTVRGAGKCIDSNWYNSTIIVHVRDDQ